jgi:hypothetical protein
MGSKGEETKDDWNGTNALPQDRCASIQERIPYAQLSMSLTGLETGTTVKVRVEAAAAES